MLSGNVCQDEEELADLVCTNCLTGEPEPVERPSCVARGFPCVDVSEARSYADRVKAKHCIRDGSHTTGKVYRAGARFHTAIRVPNKLQENVPCANQRTPCARTHARSQLRASTHPLAICAHTRVRAR